jgi:DNA-binding transcriptional regulator GbsR (MarR family)
MKPNLKESDALHVAASMIEKVCFLNDVRQSYGTDHLMAAMLMSKKLDFTVKELAEIVDSSKGSIHGYMKALEAMGWVEHDPGIPRKYHTIRAKVLEDYETASKRVTKSIKKLTKPQVIKTNGGECIETSARGSSKERC